MTQTKSWQAKSTPSHRRFTSTERTSVAGSCVGKSVRQVAVELGLQPSTVHWVLAQRSLSSKKEEWTPRIAECVSALRHTKGRRNVSSREVLAVLGPTAPSQRTIQTVMANMDTQPDHGARPHIARCVLEYLSGKNVTVMEGWPPYSPDLNPIELVGAVQNWRVSDFHPTTRQELLRAVRRACEQLKQKEIDSFCSCFPKRIKRCIQRKGKP